MLKQNIRTGSLIVALLVAAGCAYWGWLAGWGSGGNLVFRSKLTWIDGKPQNSNRIAEWRLNIPEGFIVRKESYYRTIYEYGRNDWSLLTWWQRFPDGASYVAILSALNSSDEVVPLDRALNSRGELRDFTLRIGNDAEMGKKFGGNYCVSEDQVFSSVSSGCTADQKNCAISLSFRGWPARVSVPKGKLYDDPNRVCVIVRETLTKWTDRIDDLNIIEKSQ